MVRSVGVLGLTLLLASVPVRADAVHNIATALDYAGFDIRGSNNPLSGGVELLIARNFNGNYFNFGAADLLLQGPISLQVTAGGRILPTFDMSLTTAVNAQNPATELNYNFNASSGPQSTSISGSTLIDSKFSINALGFYNLTLSSSTRSTIDRSGVVTESGTSDSDVGPTTVSGNIFADILTVLTDPLFAQTGSANPFAAFSKTLIDLYSDGPVNLSSLSDLSTINALDASLGLDSLQDPMPRANPGAAAAHVIVPEPPVLVLLLLGLPVVIRRAWRTR